MNTHPLTMTTLLYPIALAALLLAAPPARAGEGHDHGPATSAATGPALPRFALTSPTFELVGTLNGHDLTLYLDQAATNEPVTQARIELNLAGAKHVAQPHDGTFEVELAAEPQADVLPITATVTVDGRTDVLTGELDLHADAPEPTHAFAWPAYAGWAVTTLVALTAAGLLVRRLRARRQGAPA